ncbi:MAG: M24 family metallopeptidase [Planctomycetaceae bacterium]|nr:M24 family metallopeptidase [Planctomycetaceae bacterium]
MFDLGRIQQALVDFGFDGWLLYDFRGSNVLAQRVLQMPEGFTASRRYFYFIPADGEPQKLVHQIEQGVLDHLPGEKHVYLKWQTLEELVEQLVKSCRTLAMEYSPRNGNPYISRVDAGTVELVRSFGCDVRASGDLISLFEATLTDEQFQLHYEATTHTTAAFELAWKFIADQVRQHGHTEEIAVQNLIMQHFADHQLTTYHPPIVAVNGNSGNPHYETGTGDNTRIQEGDFVLLDLWAKMQTPGAVYSDLTRTGFVGSVVPDRYTEIFNIVAAARDAGIALAEQSFAAGTVLQGGQVDDAVRAVIAEAGYADAFCHRTGHSMGQETHGNGTHMDNLETHETRRILPRTLFTIEPGIYLKEFGVRSEIDVLIHESGRVEVTGGPIQREVVAILKDF